MRPLDCLCIQLSMFIYIFLTQFSVFTYVYRMLRSMCIIIVITVHIIELLCWWRSSCTDFIRAEMLIGRLVGSPAWVSGWLVVGGVQVVRWAVAPFFFYIIFDFGHVNRQEPERNRNRIEFHLINAVCYARPNCVKCVPAALVTTSVHLDVPSPPSPSHSTI